MPRKSHRAPTRPAGSAGRVLAAMVATTSLGISLTLLTPSANADDSSPPVNAVSSTGGVATAEGNSSVQTGDIITGMNTGHSVETGGTTNGDINVTVDAMSSDSNLDVTAEVGPQVADASGGDEGNAEAGPGNEPPNVNVNIRNRSNNNNRSDATGIGTGGEGGAGGAGGNATINGAPTG